MSPCANTRKRSFAQLANKLVKFIKMFLIFSVGYPQYSRDYVDRHIKPLGPAFTDDELIEWQPPGYALIVRLLYVASSAIYIVRALGWPAAVFNEINFDEPSANLRQLKHSRENYYQFNCFVSNCTHPEDLLVERAGPSDLTSNNDSTSLISKVLIGLPHVLLCHPKISSISDFTQHFGIVGMYLTSVCCVTLLVAGLMCPLAQLIDSTWTTHNLLMMFLVAPKTSQGYLQGRARYFALEVHKSLEIFKSIEIDYHTTEPMGQIEVGFKRSLRLNKYLVWAPQKNVNLSPGPSHKLSSPAYLEAFARDCVSVTRTDWWRTKMATLMVELMVSAASGFTLAALVALRFVLQYVKEREHQLRALGRHIRLRGACFLWIRGDDHDHWQSADLERVEILFSIPYNLLYGLQVVWPFVVMGLLMIHYLLTMAELACLLHELKFQLRIAIEIVREIMSREHDYHLDCLHDVCEKKSFEKHSLKEQTGADVLQNARIGLPIHQHYSLSLLRKQFKQLPSIFLFFVNCKLLGDDDCRRHRRLGRGGGDDSKFQSHGTTKSRLKSALACKRFAERQVRSWQLDGEAAIELLEKLYISTRMLLEHMRNFAPAMSLIIVLSNAYTYGVTLVCLILLRKAHDLVVLPALLILSSWFLSNMIIVTAANVHAKGKELHTLIWTLVAVTCNCKDVRMRHLRSLWTRQVEALEADGGLGLRALGVRITYTRVLQLLIGSGTILVLALH